MNLSDFDAYKQAEKFVKNVIKTAKQLNNLETGAVVASTAGFIGLAIIVHISFTVFVLMSGSLLVYRFVVYRQETQDNLLPSNLRAYDDVLDRKQRLWQSALPEEEKKQLSEHLDSLLGAVEKKGLRTVEKRKKLKP